MLRAPITTAVVLLSAVVAACGGDDAGTTAAPAASAPAATAAPATAARDIAVKMSEFAFDPADVVATAGKVTITASNAGTTAHELVVLKTDADPAKVPKKDGEVDESTSVGEVADVAAGAEKSITLDLKPGNYAMVCALPGHYEGGMHGSFKVE